MACAPQTTAVAHHKRALGFTIVELVVVILLLGILSATALSRFVEPSAFAPRTTGSAYAAQAHFAALTAQTNAADVELTLLPGGGEWRMDVAIGGISRRQTEVDVANTRIEVGNGALTGDVDAANSLRLTFSGDGEVVAASLGAAVLNPDLGVEVRIIGDSTRVLCVYPTGYAGAQAC